MMILTVFWLIVAALCCIGFYYMGILTILLIDNDKEEER